MGEAETPVSTHVLACGSDLLTLVLARVVLCPAVATACGEPLLKPNGNHALTVTVAVNNAEGLPCAEIKAELILLKDRKKA